MIELVKRLNERQALVRENKDYYLVTQSKTYVPIYHEYEAPEPEVLVFPCNPEGVVAEWLEVNGERGATLEEYLPKLLQSNKVNLYD
jgi:hypothetical protein